VGTRYPLSAQKISPAHWYEFFLGAKISGEYEYGE
jgi:hypothetical protein